MELAADGTPTTPFRSTGSAIRWSSTCRAPPAAGKVILKPREGAKWPVRLAFRVTPGTLGLIEVQADQRMLIPVTREGTKPVDIELVPGVYTPKTHADHGAMGDSRVGCQCRAQCHAATGSGCPLHPDSERGQRAAPHAARIEPDHACRC